MNKAKAKGSEARQTLATHKRALQRYEILERMEAGIVLVGSEVKSLRAKQVVLDAAYAAFERHELVLHRMRIAPYAQAAAFPHDPDRSRKLLMKRRELERLEGKVGEKGLTLIPTQVYLKGGRAKVEVCLARAKALHDKREELKRTQDLKEARAVIAKYR